MPLRFRFVALGVAGMMAFPTVLTSPSVALADPVSVASTAADPAEQDAAFLAAAHQTNLAEVAAGRIAWGKTTDPTVRNLAGTFMRHHIHLDADLYDVARDLRVALPFEPNEEQKALAGRYQAAPADTFAEYYIVTQLAGHRESIALISRQIAEGSDPLVVELATKARPVIESHVELLRAAAAEKNLVGYDQGGGRS